MFELISVAVMSTHRRKLHLKWIYTDKLHIQILYSFFSPHILSYLPCGDFHQQSEPTFFVPADIHYHIFKWQNGASGLPVPPPTPPPIKHTVLGSVKEAGSVSIYPCRACDRCRGGIMIDLQLQNSLLAQLLISCFKTYRGTEEWRARRKKLFCSLSVSAASPRCSFCNTMSLVTVDMVWSGSNSTSMSFCSHCTPLSFLAQFL